MLRKHIVLSFAGVTLLTGVAASGEPASGSVPSTATPPPKGRATFAPREEIRPRFALDAHGGRDGKGSFVIEAEVVQYAGW